MSPIRVMINFQERTYYDQIKEIDDDFVPYLMPWYGTIVTASALGCQIEYFTSRTGRQFALLPHPDRSGCQTDADRGP